MRQWRQGICVFLTVGILMGSVGCGNRESSVREEAGKTDTGAAAFQARQGKDGLEANAADIASIEAQLRVIAKDAKTWRAAEYEGDAVESMKYAITDLDQNGRLEIIASTGTQGSGRFTYTDFFQVNQTGNAIKKIATDYDEGESQADITEQFSTAYYDGDSGEYHYMTGDFATGGIATGYYKDITVLTLKDDTIRSDLLAYELREKNKKGKMKSSFYRMDKEKKTKIDAADFSEEQVGNAAYPKCGKLSVNLSWFPFAHSLENTTEEQTLYALKGSYQEFSLGYPLVQKKVKICGVDLRVPQYEMEDAQKQKRLNEMIRSGVEQSLQTGFLGLENIAEDPDFSLGDFAVSIKYVGTDCVSLLLDAEGDRDGAAHSAEWCDTITIDLDREQFVSQQDILPEKYREEVAEDVMDGVCTDIRYGDYRKYRKKNGKGKLFDTQEYWEDVKVYRTRDAIGLVIPTSHARGSYAIYEVPSLFEEGTDAVSYQEIDWEAYRYQLLSTEYNALQDYMPLLKEETAFAWIYQKFDKKGNVTDQKKSVTITQFLKAREKEADLSGKIEFHLQYIQLCDLTGDGAQELVLTFPELGEFSLVLHREGKEFFGAYFEVRRFDVLQTNGVYLVSGGMSGAVCQMKFENGIFTVKELGRYQTGGKKSHFYISGKEVEEEDYLDWEDDIMIGDVVEYTPVCRE